LMEWRSKYWVIGSSCVTGESAANLAAKSSAKSGEGRSLSSARNLASLRPESSGVMLSFSLIAFVLIHWRLEGGTVLNGRSLLTLCDLVGVHSIEDAKYLDMSRKSFSA